MFKLRIKALYVARTTNHQIAAHWGFIISGKSYRYVQCDKEGNINWATASIYTADELVVRNNVVIIPVKWSDHWKEMSNKRKIQ